MTRRDNPKDRVHGLEAIGSKPCLRRAQHGNTNLRPAGRPVRPLLLRPLAPRPAADDVFETFVHAGQLVGTNEVVKRVFCPNSRWGRGDGGVCQDSTQWGTGAHCRAWRECASNN